jgi:hypothetical protein
MKKELQMKKMRALHLVVTAGALFTGCIAQPDAARPKRTELDQLLSVFNADLGEEGVAVGRRELRDILEGDPELLDSVRSDLANGLDDLIMSMTDLDEESSDEMIE